MPPSPRSDAARDVHHAIDRIARDYRDAHDRDASAPELALLLARWFCPARLKRETWFRRRR